MKTRIDVRSDVTTLVHRAPRHGETVMPCCGAAPTGKQTGEWKLVTCTPVMRRLLSNIVEIQCERCNFTDRKVTVEWETEYGDMGSKLGSYPVFSVEPPCPGPEHEVFSTDGRHISYERVPDACPFSKDYGNDTAPEWEAVFAVLRERKAIRELM